MIEIENRMKKILKSPPKLKNPKEISHLFVFYVFQDLWKKKISHST
jgi:hypothetical protein